MRSSHLCITLIVAAAVIFRPGEPSTAAVPSLVNYQGILTDGSGTPQVGTFSVTFSIYDDASATNPALWTETQSVITDTEGKFNVLLGSMTPLTDPVFSGTDRWLGTKVSPDVSDMLPRTRIVTVAYAFRAATVDGASGGSITSKVSIGPGHTNTGTDAFVAGQNNQVVANYSTVGGGALNNATGESSVISGGQQHTASGFASTVSGGASNTTSNTYSTIGGGLYNTSSGGWSVVGGGQLNTASEEGAVVGGGGRNHARGQYSTVSGGGGVSDADSNSALGPSCTIGGGSANVATGTGATVGGGGQNSAFAFATVAGGNDNSAGNFASTVGGGEGNDATGFGSTIGGGRENAASAQDATVGGGQSNTAAELGATVAGGRANEATERHATVGGGFVNRARGQFSVVSGGGGPNVADSNAALADQSTIGGGSGNRASGVLATVSGGLRNNGSGYGSVIGGGQVNTTSNDFATICGGQQNIASRICAAVVCGEFNTASGSHSAVGGGSVNTAAGDYATVPGGAGNTASGLASFAAGASAEALHEGTFVWGDNSGGPFSSTGVRQFLIRAGGGVGIGTNAPQEQLSVVSGMNIDQANANAGTTANGLKFGSSSGEVIASKRTPGGNQYGLDFYTNSVNRMSIANATGYVGFGLTSPAYRIDLPNVLSPDGQGRANAWVIYSSRRWKTDIHTIEAALSKIERLRGVTYRPKDGGAEQVGLIAEEVGEVVPQVVQYEENGVDASSIDYARLVALLIEGMKEQEERIEALEKKLDQQTQ